jgi:multidrug resistance efflux pump
LQRKEFALKTTSARVNKTEADIKSAESTLRQAETELGVLSVTAPRDGPVLQVNVREGEYANNTSTEGLMLLGETEKLQVRAEVDEQNAPLVQASLPAAAFLKGSTENKMDLHFVRIEPFVVPKRSLTGDSLERVDTRVLQIIFEFDRPAFPVYVGQQVDVFIRSDRSVRDTVPATTQ